MENANMNRQRGMESLLSPLLFFSACLAKKIFLFYFMLLSLFVFIVPSYTDMYVDLLFALKNHLKVFVYISRFSMFSVNWRFSRVAGVV